MWYSVFRYSCESYNSGVVVSNSERAIIGLETTLDKLELMESYHELFFIFNKLANFWQSRGYDV
jgi:hypothetical protein